MPWFGTEMDAAIIGGAIGIAGAVIGALAAWLLTLLSSLVAWWWTSPTLVVEFDKAEDCITTTPEKYPTKAVGEMGGVIYATRVATFARIRVRNTGGKIAEECRAWLIRIEEKRDGKFNPTEFRSSMPLIWSYNPELPTVSIPKDVVWNADVVKFAVGLESFEPCLRANDGSTLKPERFVPLFTRPGHYRLHLLVSSQTASSQPITIEFVWNGSGLPEFQGL